MADLKQILLNTFLNLSHESGSLRDIAYAKAVLWTLLCEDKELTLDEIVKLIGQLFGQNSVPRDSLRTAIDLLVMKKLILEKNNSFKLSPIQQESMNKQIKYSHQSTEAILNKRFPSSIDKSNLKKWFDEVNSVYFGASADKLISLHSDNQKPVFKVDSVLKPIIKSYEFEKFELELIQGYKEFLTSTNRQEEEKVFSLLSSVLSSKLVTANLSPEKISLEKFRDSKFLLDTNVLFSMGVDREQDISKVLESLGKSTKTLGISLFVTDFTIGEYEKVVTRERENYITLINSYSKEIFEGMSNHSDFHNTIVTLGCENEQDVKTFFDVTLKVPERLESSNIELLQGREVKGTYFIEGNDNKLLNDIRKETGKVGATAEHDLRLCKLVNKMRSKGKAFVLTLDSSMERFSMNQVNEKEEPSWISLFSLIQIFAINGGGPDFYPADLAPFIRTFIDFEEATKEERYDERDLLLLVEKTDRVNELSETQMVNLLNKLHRIRLKRSPEEGVREVVLELDRTLRGNSKKADSLVKEKQNEFDSLASDKQDVDGRLDKVCVDLKQQKVHKIYIFFIIRVFFYLSVALILSLYLKEEILLDYLSGDRYQLVTKVAFVAAFIGAIITDYITYTSKKIDEVESKTIC